MAKKESRVSQEKLKLMVDNWKSKSIPELAQTLNITETTLGFWAMKLRKSMRAQGMTSEQIADKLPSKRRVAANVFDEFAKSMAEEPPSPIAKKQTVQRKKKNNR